MKHARDFWPMAREFGFDFEDEDLPIRCEPCEGTGTAGVLDLACQCDACKGRGALPLPSSIIVEAGHA